MMNIASFFLGLPTMADDLCATGGVPDGISLPSVTTVPTSGWAASELDPLAFTSSFVIDDTPRYQITGSTEVTMTGPTMVSALLWRPMPREIISDVVRDHLLRNLTRELGEPEHERTADGQLWRWTADGCVRELVSTESAVGETIDVCFCERAAWAGGALELDGIPAGEALATA